MNNIIINLLLRANLVRGFEGILNFMRVCLFFMHNDFIIITPTDTDCLVGKFSGAAVVVGRRRRGVDRTNEPDSGQEWTHYDATETMPESQGNPARVDKIRLGRVAIC